MTRTSSWRWATAFLPFLAIAASAAATTGQQARQYVSAQATQGSIAFGGGAIHRRYPDGRISQLTTGKSDRFPSWSWDGTQIAFERESFPDTSHCPLFVVNSDGSGLRQVGQVQTDCSGASWAPDDARLVFGETGLHGLNGAGLSIVGADGGGVRRVFEGSGRNFEGAHPAWSPDGRTIVFGWTAGPRVGLLAIHPDGTGVQTLIKPRARHHFDVFSFPAWSRDGRRLAFIHVDLGKARSLEVANARGRHRAVLARLPFNPGEQGTPSWSPRGVFLAFWGISGHGGGTWTIRSRGGRRQLLVRNYVEPSWGPAGT